MSSAATATLTNSSVSSGPDSAVMEAINDRGNVVVFLDVSMGEDEAKAAALGRIKLELFVKECPKTCENFRQFCTGEHAHSNGSPMGYKGASFHRVMKDFMIQGGDFVNNDGSGKMSIYGSTFADENLTLPHSTPGVLSSANSGPDSNGCQFFITTNKCEWLNGKHVVFGRVLDSESMLTVRKIEAVPVSGSNNRPRIPIRITQCGEL